MCGRFALPIPARSLAEQLSLSEFTEYPPRYNIAPTNLIPAVILDSKRHERILRMFHWGLIPFWAKDTKIGSKMINVRAETITEKPAFRSAFKKRRCLIPAAGFYEWKKETSGKNPYYIYLRDGKPMIFAGLWEQWGKDGEFIESCTIITTTANNLVEELHSRMPVILNPKDYDTWLDTEKCDADSLTLLLKPYPQELMTMHPVSSDINSPRYDNSSCIDPLE